MEQIRQAGDRVKEDHERQLSEMTKLAETTAKNRENEAVAWLKAQLEQLQGKGKNDEEEERIRQEEEEKAKKIQELEEQQRHIQEQLSALSNKPSSTPGAPQGTLTELLQGKDCQQKLLMQQLQAALTNKEESTSDRALLRTMLNSNNKVPGLAGTNTLRPDIMHKLGPDNTTNMAEWLANLNK